MNYFLIDYENTKLSVNDDLVKCSEGDKVIVFFSNCCKNISMDIVEDIIKKGASFSCIEIKQGTKNALDFQLSSYLGFIIGSGCEDANIYIVSKDKGYDCLCDFWQNLYNMKVERIARMTPQEQVQAPNINKTNNVKNTNNKHNNTSTTNTTNKTNTTSNTNATNKPKSNNKKSTKVSPADRVTIEEVRKYISEEEYPEVIMDILNAYKAKSSINNAISKHYRDSKMAGKIYKKLKVLLKEKNKS